MPSLHNVGKAEGWSERPQEVAGPAGSLVFFSRGQKSSPESARPRNHIHMQLRNGPAPRVPRSSQISSHEARPPRVEQIWGGGQEARKNAFPPLGSSSCHCHGYLCFLFDSSQTAEVRGGGHWLPAQATAAWGCLQQPRVGFPERDSKPDILRLQNTQVSRAKNSCHRAPATQR